MFSRLFGKDDKPKEPKAPAPASEPARVLVEPYEDPAAGDPTARAWIDRLARGERDGLGDFLGAQPTSALRSYYSRTLASSLTDAYPEWVDAWAEAEPASAVARQFRGNFLVAWAWAIRGGKRANKTKADQFAAFFEVLEVAREELEGAAALAPSDGGPVASLLDVARGLQAPRDAVDELFAEAQRREPWMPGAARSMVQYLAPKWYGSVGEVLAFARSVRAEAPAGLSVHEVIADAHIEAWLETSRGDGYWKQAGIADEILAAAAASIDVFESDAPWDMSTRGTFAFCYWKLGLKDRLRPELERIGPNLTYPWTMLRSPANDLMTSRTSVGLSRKVPVEG